MSLSALAQRVFDRFVRDPAMRKRLARFRANRRAFRSLVALGIALAVSLFAELVCNDRPYVLRYDGTTYFPILKYYPGTLFGETVRPEADYKALVASDAFRASGNWALFPPVPHHPNASMPDLAAPPPTPPDRRNWLGTDDRGRDLLARLLYGFRNSMLFALGTTVLVVVGAFLIGATQGLLGGRIDFVGQRLTEIWNALPVLYVVIFLLSIFPPSLLLLALVWVAFSWIPLAGYVRAEVLRVRQLEYVTAARALGLRTPRILFRHVLPNTLMPILTFAPFLVSAGVGSLAALDYLGLGLPPPAASWGELLRQGKENLSSWWLAFFPFFSLFSTLCLLNFVGEGLRDAFDPKGA